MESKSIKKIEIRGLYGQFDYEIPKNGDLGSPTILYGDNGVGKSTILEMVFHLLSPAPNRSHRSKLKTIPFEKIAIHLNSGYEIRAVRHDFDPDNIIILTIFLNQKPISEWIHVSPTRGTKNEFEYEFILERLDIIDDLSSIPSEFKKIKELYSKLSTKGKGISRGEKSFIEKLQEIVPVTFLVSAERRLESDAIEENDDFEFRRLMSRKDISGVRDIIQKTRQFALTQALNNAAGWINARAVQSANQASMNVHSVYEQVLLQLSIDYGIEGENFSDDSTESLKLDLNNIESKTKEFSQFELMTGLSMGKFKSALESGTHESRGISARLIEPYIKSINGRLTAIEPIYQILRNFVDTVNSFLSRKELQYNLTRGFWIQNNIGTRLEPNSLSSGEQQLLLLFCYALTGRDESSIFIIDEPEISLNIKWQRQLIKSLMGVASGSGTQFIFASHSLELIAQHRNRVVELEG